MRGHQPENLTENSEIMKTIDSKFNTSTNHAIRPDDCSESVQTRISLDAVTRRFKRLGLWLTAQLIAHDNRVSALGVYRQQRLDGRDNNTAKHDRRTSQ